MNKKNLLYIGLIAIGIFVIVFVGLYISNPEFLSVQAITPSGVTNKMPSLNNGFYSATTTSSENTSIKTESNGTQDIFDGLILKAEANPNLYEVQVLDTKTGNPKGNVSVVNMSGNSGLVIGKDYYFITTYNSSKNVYEITRDYMSGAPVSPGFE